MIPKRILTLHLKKQWFEEIKSGVRLNIVRRLNTGGSGLSGVNMMRYI